MPNDRGASLIRLNFWDLLITGVAVLRAAGICWAAVQAVNDFTGHVEPWMSGSGLYGIGAKPSYGGKYWRRKCVVTINTMVSVVIAKCWRFSIMKWCEWYISGSIDAVSVTDGIGNVISITWETILFHCRILCINFIDHRRCCEACWRAGWGKSSCPVPWGALKLFHMAEYCDTPLSKDRRNREYKVCLNERAILRLLDHNFNEEF